MYVYPTIIDCMLTGADVLVEYPSLNGTLPFQVDGWLRVNDDREIEAFDLVFRHFPSVSLSVPITMRIQADSLIADGPSCQVRICSYCRCPKGS
jgi:hypothetical protein